MKTNMGPIDNRLGDKPIKAHDISAKAWEGSGSDARTDASGMHGREGTAKDKAADSASRKAINSRINGPRQ